MKKGIKITIIVSISIVIFMIALNFITFRYNNFKFNITLGKVYITDYEGFEKHLEIPSKIFGFPVVSISGCQLSSETESVVVPEGVEKLKDAFSNCYGIVEKDMDYANNEDFYNYYGLKRIKLPNSLKSIEGNSFFKCHNLKSITIPKNVEKIDVIDYPDSDDSQIIIFDGCTSLEEIQVDSENEVYKSVDGVLYNYKDKAIVKCPEAKQGDVVIPNWCKKIYCFDEPTIYSPFKNCKYITSVIFPKKFVISDYNKFNLFPGCESIKNID